MRRRWFNVLAALVAAALSVGLYRAKHEADDARRSVAELEREIARLETENRLLAAEAALLERPERIEKLAREHLGMAPARLDQRRGPEALSEALAERAP